MTVKTTKGNPDKVRTHQHIVRAKDGGLFAVTLSRKQAMAIHCTECMGWSNPSECPCVLCAMYPFRKKTEVALRGNVKDCPDGWKEQEEYARTNLTDKA